MKSVNQSARYWKGGLVLAVALSFFVLGCVGQRSQSLEAAGGSLTPAQYFTLKDTVGQTVSLKRELASHKAVLINFFATWCPPCREEIPDLIRLQDQYKNKSFTVLAVNVNESQAKVARFAEKMGMNYPIALDESNAVSQEYQVVGIPTSYLLSSDGKILGEYHAAGDDLFEAVEKALTVR